MWYVAILDARFRVGEGDSLSCHDVGGVATLQLVLLFREKRLLSLSRGDAFPTVPKRASARSAGRRRVRIMASICAK